MQINLSRFTLDVAHTKICTLSNSYLTERLNDKHIYLQV